MLKQLTRLPRAFVTALRVALRGDNPHRKYPRLQNWIEDGQRHVKALQEAAAAAGWDERRQRDLILHLDSRDISMYVILGGVEHHFKREYPHLLLDEIEHNLTAITALNINDLYRVQQLQEAEALQNSPLQEPLNALRTHLEALPAGKSGG